MPALPPLRPVCCSALTRPHRRRWGALLRGALAVRRDAAALCRSKRPRVRLHGTFGVRSGRQRQRKGACRDAIPPPSRGLERCAAARARLQRVAAARSARCALPKCAVACDATAGQAAPRDYMHGRSGATPMWAGAAAAAHSAPTQQPLQGKRRCSRHPECLCAAAGLGRGGDPPAPCFPLLCPERSCMRPALLRRADAAAPSPLARVAALGARSTAGRRCIGPQSEATRPSARRFWRKERTSTRKTTCVSQARKRNRRPRGRRDA